MTTKPAPNEKRRDPQVHQAILDATVALLEELGYKKLSIEAIAARAGVGKQTIYRWWRGKADLVIEAFARAAEIKTPEPDSGVVAHDLLTVLLFIFKETSDYTNGSVLAAKGMMAEAQLDREFLATFMELIHSWHGSLRTVLERAKTRGDLRATSDIDALIDMLMGAIWYRILLEHAPLDRAYGETLIHTVLNGNRPDA